MTARANSAIRLESEVPVAKGAGPRDRLLANAGLLFAERGVESVTIREIAAAANVQLSDIYRHFTDKNDLYAEVCRQLFHGIAVRYESILGSKAAPTRRLLLFTSALYSDLSKDKTLAPILVRELLLRDKSNIAEYVDEFFQRQFYLLVDCLRVLGFKSDAEPVAYSIYVLALGHVQLTPFGQAIPIRDLKWDDPNAMARSILRVVMPAVDWTQLRVGPIRI